MLLCVDSYDRVSTVHIDCNFFWNSEIGASGVTEVAVSLILVYKACPLSSKKGEVVPVCN
jgi:hypothetical protein